MDPRALGAVGKFVRAAHHYDAGLSWTDSLLKPQCEVRSYRRPHTQIEWSRPPAYRCRVATGVAPGPNSRGFRRTSANSPKGGIRLSAVKVLARCSATGNPAAAGRRCHSPVVASVLARGVFTKLPAPSHNRSVAMLRDGCPHVLEGVDHMVKASRRARPVHLSESAPLTFQSW